MNDWLETAKKESEAESEVTEKEYAPTWKPDEGDMLAGTVIKGDYLMTSNGEAHMLVVQDEETKQEYTVWCSSYMLKQAVIDLAPAEGSLIVIQFHGKKQSKKDTSRSYNHYTMQVERSDFTYWDEIFKRFRARAEQMNPAGNGGPAPSFGPDEAPF